MCEGAYDRVRRILHSARHPFAFLAIRDGQELTNLFPSLALDRGEDENRA